jgi:UDP-N-acetylglucosamine 4,6-dehydratase/5-epimerase
VLCIGEAIVNSSGKTILITGGTGSFGSKMIHRLLKKGECKEVRVFSRDELKQEHMRIELGDPRVKFYLGDVRDRSSVDYAMNGVDYVFHAAALKQVPSCEFFPMQAVQTNIEGSANVVQSAIAAGVDRLVCLSTDKAVYPVNAMGMSKALMEKVAQSYSREGENGKTVVSIVRYGNVMYSRGSVIPLFVKQMAQGKPLTVTNPDMTRFMLSLETAVELVEFAWLNANPGDIFVRKAPACTVHDLAVAMCELFNSSSKVSVIGERHGEKLYEVLASNAELRRSEDMGDYLRVTLDGRDLNYSKYYSEGDTAKGEVEDYTSHNTDRLSIPQVKDLLLTLPEIRADLGMA